MASYPGISHNLQEQVCELLKHQKVCLIRQVKQHKARSRAEPRLLVMSLWRAYLVNTKQPVTVEGSFNYLEICSIAIHSLNQVVIETDTEVFLLSLTFVEDLEAMISHVTASLKKIFPDSSPGKILKNVPPDLQERLRNLTSHVEEQLEGTPGPCGGFSDTYAALCDFNDFRCREEVQWDVNNIYHVRRCREFSLLDFSHLDSQDLALVVAALSFNQWFTRFSSRHFKLTPDVQQQVLFMIHRSPSLEELSLEASGLKQDFVVKMAAALRDNTSSNLHTINLSANQIEDKGVMALSLELDSLSRGLTHLSLSRTSVSPKGVGVLSQVLSSNQVFATCLTHLDLSDNPGILATDDAMSLFLFLSRTNCVSYLDLSGTDCPLDTLFVSLSAGCCSRLAHINLARNPFTYRKVREVTRSVREFFSQCVKLQYCGLSQTRLPAQALRLLLQGLATNPHLSGLELDISSSF
ncbi:capping protein, Arp2/3 and myosin-I linker protein 2 [Hypomesus transpacificus]|uniref:capping protein, Arp2/3 and myosin-I linker protein 2 n=1 Tax=Hypomesus transpacificus TaxID=137520 RepID=UPI001F07C474|nr:capping protein, Arp2/3 and myosin-I linker protein 2 [Hypomesus transpacificus]